MDLSAHCVIIISCFVFMIVLHREEMPSRGHAIRMWTSVWLYVGLRSSAIFFHFLYLYSRFPLFRGKKIRSFVRVPVKCSNGGVYHWEVTSSLGFVHRPALNRWILTCVVQYRSQLSRCLRHEQYVHGFKSRSRHGCPCAFILFLCYSIFR
jgi:hypothetical protein